MNIKKNDKTTRLRYIRVLEKFLTKTISLVKKENFDFNLYKTAVTKNYKELQKTPSIELYSEYPKALKSTVQYILDSVEEEHITDFKTQRDTILKNSNLLEKLKNNNRYKKDKHKKQKFHDGY